MMKNAKKKWEGRVDFHLLFLFFDLIEKSTVAKSHVTFQWKILFKRLALIVCLLPPFLFEAYIQYEWMIGKGEEKKRFDKELKTRVMKSTPLTKWTSEMWTNCRRYICINMVNFWLNYCSAIIVREWIKGRKKRSRNSFMYSRRRRRRRNNINVLCNDLNLKW